MTNLTAIAIEFNQLNAYYQQMIIKFIDSIPTHLTRQLALNVQSDLDYFYKVCLAPTLNQKIMVGIGGAFSAGKSSFLNSLMQHNLLSTEIDPTTSIATYVVYSNKSCITAILKSGEAQVISVDQFKNLTHHSDSHTKSLSEKIDFIVVEQQNTAWHNLVFLDTPGYSNSDTDFNHHNSDNHDFQIAYSYLNDTHHIVWLISADQGGISDNDVQFLKTLKADIPKLILISRADKKNLSDLTTIKTITQKTLQQHHINVDDILLYSARALEQFDDTRLHDYLYQWNTTATQHAPNLTIFSDFMDYFAEIRKLLLLPQQKQDLDTFQQQLFEKIYNLAQSANINVEQQWQAYQAEQTAREQQRQKLIDEEAADQERQRQAIAAAQEAQRQALEMQQLQDLMAQAQQLKNQAQALQQPVRRSLETILKSYEDEISRPSAGSYATSDDIYDVRKKVEKAVKAYAYEGDGEYDKYNDDPLVMIDTTTIFKNAENGLYLTYHELYCKQPFSKRFCISIHDIRSIRFDKDESKLYVNSTEQLFVPQNNLKNPMIALVKAIKEYISQD